MQPSPPTTPPTTPNNNDRDDILRKFTEQSALAQQLYRRVVVFGGILFGSVKGFFLMNQLLWPWQMEPHSSYRGRAPASVVSLWEFCSMLLYFYVPVAAAPALEAFRKKYKVYWIPYVGVAFFIVTWIHFVGTRVNAEMIWFFLGNVVYYLVARYAEYVVQDSERQVAELNAHTKNQ